MAQKTVTRADLAEAVYESVGLSRTESAELVERVLDMIAEALVKGENVKLSSFGSFQVRSKNQRIGRNPKTGEEVPDPAPPGAGVQTQQRVEIQDQQIYGSLWKIRVSSRVGDSLGQITGCVPYDFRGG